MNGKPALGSVRPAFFCAPILQNQRLWAAVFLLLGYGFWECFWLDGPFSWPLALALFGLGYAGAVLAFALAHGCAVSKESWLWLAVWQALLWSFCAPWAFSDMGDSLGAALFLSAVAAAGYWAYSVCGGLTLRRTSIWLAVDLACCFFAAPLGNFDLLARHLLGRQRKARNWRSTAAALAGLCAGVGLCAVALPLLAAADREFAAFFSHFSLSLPRDWGFVLGRWAVKSVFALPTACYLYGLCQGPVLTRPTGAFRRDELYRAALALRAVPLRTEALALGILCALYGIFAVFQARYLAGALFGALPADFTYASYARQGFFQLLEVALLDAVVLWGVWASARRGPRTPMLQALCGALCALTGLLLLTAAIKLGLYVQVYGWTIQRFRASIALLWLCWVFLVCGARLRRKFDPVPVVVLPGALLWLLITL